MCNDLQKKKKGVVVWKRKKALEDTKVENDIFAIGNKFAYPGIISEQNNSKTFIGKTHDFQFEVQKVQNSSVASKS